MTSRPDPRMLLIVALALCTQAASAQTGACCLPDGTCIVQNGQECQQRFFGVYQGDGTICRPGLCPEPNGACCFPSGQCTFLPRAHCAQSGGLHQGPGTTCAPNTCPQPSGACCLADGTCFETLLADCLDAGGVYQGHFTRCAASPCPHCNIVETMSVTAGDGGEIGSAIALSGEVMVVGATSDDDAGTDAGAAYFFRFDGSRWHEEAKVTASTPGANDRFGHSVAIDGDVAVVGGLDTDAAFVFEFDGVTWAEVARLTASSQQGLDAYGEAVAISGDTVVVGSRLNDIGGVFNVGSLYVYQRPPGGWTDMTQTALLFASDATAGDVLGSSVSISDDVVVGGALGADGPGGDLGVGAAYLFQKPPGGWLNMSHTAKLTASDGAALDWFGSAVDVDGDTVVVGCPNDDDGAGGAGSLYVFQKPPGGWSDATETAKLVAIDAASQDALGTSVTISGDRVVGGAPGDGGGGGNSGAAYLYSRSGAGWTDMTESAKLTASDLDAVDDLGNSFAADLHGGTVALGATIAAYVYRLDDCDADGALDACKLVEGSGADRNGNGILDACECPADTNGDGLIDVHDLVSVIVAWGSAGPAGDVNGDGIVDVADLLAVILAWGRCAPP